MILIVGYPDSGKSAAAEEMALQISGPGERIYLATMIPYGDEGEERIRRHREMRSGKGFNTIEAPFDIAGALDGTEDAENKTVLLECLSNLVANELFERHTDPGETSAKLTSDVMELSEKVKDLIVVSNHFEPKGDYDPDTSMYIQTMDVINGMLSEKADKTIYIEKQDS